MDSVHDNLKNKDILVASLKAKVHAAGVERKRILFDHSRQAKLYRDFQADFHVLSLKIEVLRQPILKSFRILLPRERRRLIRCWNFKVT